MKYGIGVPEPITVLPEMVYDAAPLDLKEMKGLSKANGKTTRAPKSRAEKPKGPKRKPTKKKRR